MDHDDLLLRWVLQAVEFLDELNLLLFLLLAWFLAQIRPTPENSTLASRVACLSLLIYLGCHLALDDLYEAWMVVDCFGRGLLATQIVLALMSIFRIEKVVHVFTRFGTLLWRRMLKAVQQLRSWLKRLSPDPPPLPPAPLPPQPSPDERRRQALFESRTAYRQKLTLTRESKLPRMEQRRIRDHIRRRYLETVRRLLDD